MKLQVIVIVIAASFVSAAALSPEEEYTRYREELGLTEIALADKCSIGVKSVCVDECMDTKLTNAYCIRNCLRKSCDGLPEMGPPEMGDFKTPF